MFTFAGSHYPVESNLNEIISDNFFSHMFKPASVPGNNISY